MQPYQPRTIALACDLIHPPLTPDPQPAQRLHNAMFQTGRPAYSSFAVTPAGPVLSNPVTRPGAVSQVSFLPDRILFREELGGMTAEDFAVRVREVTQEIAKLRGVQVFTGQQVTLRSLINPRSFPDSKSFLRDGMFGFTGQEESLGRAPDLYGLRLVFPPENGAANAHALRIESYNNDPRSLFLEVQGSFGPALSAQGLSDLEARVLETYEFLTGRVLSFIARFDVRQEA